MILNSSEYIIVFRTMELFPFTHAKKVGKNVENKQSQAVWKKKQHLINQIQTIWMLFFFFATIIQTVDIMI